MRLQFPHLNRFRTHLASLSPGDKIIAGSLATLLALLVFLGLYTLERQFLIEVPSYGGNLREGVVGTPRFINPLLALSDADRDLSYLTHAGLMGYNASGTLVPVLAESYEKSEDGLVYTFRLRRDAEFTDGTPVTAEDVVFTVKKAQDPGLRSPERANWANILAEAIDAHTVRFTLPKAYAPFLSDATLGILPEHRYKNLTNENFPFSPLLEKPVGAGPYKVATISRDKEGGVREYRLIANADYVLGRPYLSSLTFVFYQNEEEMREALIRGTIESAAGIPTATAVSLPYARVIAAFWNQNQNPLFARIEVRKALSVAIDRGALIRDTLGGYGVPIVGPLPPGGRAEIDAVETFPNPVEEARAILTRNDWVFDDAEGVWKHEESGLALRFTLTTSNVPELKSAAEKIKEDWAAIGVPVTLQLYEPGELTASVIRPRKYEALLFGEVIRHERDLFAFWHSGERADPGLNIAQYANHTVDELLESLRQEEDSEKIVTLLIEAHDAIQSEYPAAFLYAPSFVYVYPDALHGLSLSGIASPTDRLRSAAFWYKRSELVWPVFKSE